MKRIISFFLLAAIWIIPSRNVFSQATNLPTPDHIVILIFENHGYSEIIASANAPHINALAKDTLSALFTQSYGVEHPSQPNYLDLYAGCNQGVTGDAVPGGTPFTTENLGSELVAAGRTFITYSEDLPNVGYNGASSNAYARKHNPAANWMGTGTNQIPIQTNQPFSAFPIDFSKLPDVCYVVPNLNNDMHDGTIAQGDAWMFTNLNNYIQWAKTHNSLFIMTFDEDDNSDANKVATIFAGQMVKAGTYSETINHYSILRTIEDIYGLPYACNAASAVPITDSWHILSGITDASSSNAHPVSLYPNPTTGMLTILLEKTQIGKFITLEIFDALGKMVLEKNLADMITQEIQVKLAVSGAYIIRLSDGKNLYTQKISVQ